MLTQFCITATPASSVPAEDSNKEDGGGGGTPAALLLAPSDIPLTPSRRAFVRTSEADFEKELACGYDSDGKLGPFFNAVVDEGPGELNEDGLDERVAEADQDLQTTENETNQSTEPPVDPLLGVTDDALEKMKVTELRENL